MSTREPLKLTLWDALLTESNERVRRAQLDSHVKSLVNRLPLIHAKYVLRLNLLLPLLLPTLVSRLGYSKFRNGGHILSAIFNNLRFRNSPFLISNFNFL